MIDLIHHHIYHNHCHNYDDESLSPLELITKVTDKINETVKNFNDLIISESEFREKILAIISEFKEYALGTGLTNEVDNLFNEWKEDGTWYTIYSRDIIPKLTQMVNDLENTKVDSTQVRLKNVLLDINDFNDKTKNILQNVASGNINAVLGNQNVTNDHIKDGTIMPTKIDTNFVYPNLTYVENYMYDKNTGEKVSSDVGFCVEPFRIKDDNGNLYYNTIWISNVRVGNSLIYRYDKAGNFLGYISSEQNKYDGDLYKINLANLGATCYSIGLHSWYSVSASKDFVVSIVKPISIPWLKLSSDNVKALGLPTDESIINKKGTTDKGNVLWSKYIASKNVDVGHACVPEFVDRSIYADGMVCAVAGLGSMFNADTRTVVSTDSSGLPVYEKGYDKGQGGHLFMGWSKNLESRYTVLQDKRTSDNLPVVAVQNWITGLIGYPKGRFGWLRLGCDIAEEGGGIMTKDDMTLINTPIALKPQTLRNTYNGGYELDSENNLVRNASGGYNALGNITISDKGILQANEDGDLCYFNPLSQKWYKIAMVEIE